MLYTLLGLPQPQCPTLEHNSELGSHESSLANTSLPGMDLAVVSNPTSSISPNDPSSDHLEAQNNNGIQQFAAASSQDSHSSNLPPQIIIKKNGCEDIDLVFPQDSKTLTLNAEEKACFFALYKSVKHKISLSAWAKSKNPRVNALITSRALQRVLTDLVERHGLGCVKGFPNESGKKRALEILEFFQYFADYEDPGISYYIMALTFQLGLSGVSDRTLALEYYYHALSLGHAESARQLEFLDPSYHLPSTGTPTSIKRLAGSIKDCSVTQPVTWVAQPCYFLVPGVVYYPWYPSAIANGVNGHPI